MYGIARICPTMLGTTHERSLFVRRVRSVSRASVVFVHPSPIPLILPAPNQATDPRHRGEEEGSVG